MDNNNPFDNWLNDNIQPGDQTGPFPTQRFYDRIVPGTAARIAAFNNRPMEKIAEEIDQTHNLLRTRVPRFDALMNKNMSLRTQRDNLIARYGGDFDQMTDGQLRTIWKINEKMHGNVKKARFILDSKKMLQLKIQMLNKEL
jgi:hypothetical protein